MQPPQDLFFKETHDCHEQSVLCEKAREALNRGDLHGAADACKSLLVNFPDLAQGYHLTSILFQATGNYQKAHDYSAMAAQLDSCVVRYHLQEGQILFIIKEYAQAQAAFERALELESSRAESYVWLGKSLVAQEKFAQARECFSLAREAGHLADIGIDEAACDIQCGDYETAKKRLQESLADNQPNAQIYEMLAFIALYEREFSTAETLFRKALQVDNNRAQSYFYLALFCCGSDQLSFALDYLLKALAADPVHLGSLLLLGNLFIQSGDIIAAEKAFIHVLALCPDHILAWYGLLELWKNSGCLRKNIKKLNDTLHILPDSLPLKHLRALFNEDVPAAAPAYFICAFYGAFCDLFAPWLSATAATSHLRQLVNMVKALPQLGKQQYISLLDLGCGTGVVAELLADICGISVGVDITPQMLAIARRSKKYDALYEMDMIEYMQSSDSSFDLVIAAGALRWIGNLQPFFHAARAVMRPEGLLAFILDKEHSSLAYSVADCGRYNHHETYIHDTAQSEGLQIIAHHEFQDAESSSYKQIRHLFIIKKMTIH